MARRTEITIETRRQTIVRRLGHSRTSWCERCMTEVQMLTPDEAAAVMNVCSRSIYRWIETGGVHFDESHGAVLVCARSLTARYSEALNKLTR